MPDDAVTRLLPHLESVVLAQGARLYEVGVDLKHLYFPTSAVAALLRVSENGDATKVAMVGNEGVIGVSIFMGGAASGRASVLMAGHAFRIRTAPLKAEFDLHGPVMRLMLRYTQSLITQMAQTAVCNRHHLVEQQLCCWLLLSLDRVPGDVLAITHETIASMLGVRREGVTEAAGMLRQLGLIEYHRGHLTVLNRGGVLARACECYAVVKRETDRLLPDRLAT